MGGAGLERVPSPVAVYIATAANAADATTANATDAADATDAANATKRTTTVRAIWMCKGSIPVILSFALSLAGLVRDRGSQIATDLI